MIDLDLARHHSRDNRTTMMPCPTPRGERGNRRLSLLRDRAIVKMLYSTAARVSEWWSPESRQRGQRPRSLARHCGQRQQRPDPHIHQLRAGCGNCLSGRKKKTRIGAVCIPQPQFSQRTPEHHRPQGRSRAVRIIIYHQRRPATFRHYRATQLLRAGMPLEVVQRIFGAHADVTTT